MTNVADPLHGVPFPVFFAGVWLGATTVLSLLSGWFQLMTAYPDIRETPLCDIRASGMMGLGVSIQNVLRLAVLPSGLRVSIIRLFGPFNRPFVVPWREIEATAGTMFFLGPSVKLGFGSPQLGSLTVQRATWDRLQVAGGGKVGGTLPPVNFRSAMIAVALQTAVVIGAASCFFYFMSWQKGGPSLSVAVCIAFPAVVFGAQGLFRVWQLRRYR